MALRCCFVLLLFVCGLYCIYPQDNIERLTEEIRRNPGDASLYEKRGYYLKEAGRTGEAKEDLDAAIALDPQKAYSYYLRGLIYMERESYAGAVEEFDKAIGLNPGEKSFYLARGITHLALKNLEQALEDMNSCIKNKANGGMPYFLKAIIYFRMEKYQESFRNVNIAIGIQPDSARAYELRMQLYLFCFLRPEEAMADINRIISLGEDRAIVYFCRGNIYLINREYDKAFADISKYINHTKDNNESVNLLQGYAYNIRATIYNIRREHRKALEEYELALKADPGADIYSNRGTTYLSLAEEERNPALKAEYQRKGEEDMEKAKGQYHVPDLRIIELLSKHWDRQQIYRALNLP